MGKKIFVINSGSTSVKVAVFEDDQCLLKENVKIGSEITAKFVNIIDQLPARTEIIEKFLADNNIDLSEFDMIASRGGPLPPCQGGAYAVNDWMVEVLTYAPSSPHASALSCMIGDTLAKKYDLPQIVYDPVRTDELHRLAKYTGIPGVYSNTGAHALNARAVARKTAEKIGKKFEDCRFIVAHMGGGCSFLAIEGGKEIDYVNDYKGVITPERCGGIPNGPMIDLCFSGKYTREELHKLVLGGSGFLAYVGTSDAYEVEKRADAGDETCIFLYELMAYQVAKAIGTLVPVLYGKVDRVIFTGGLARSDRLLKDIKDRIAYIAPIEIIPGELEMEALAGGALRVLNGEEEAKVFDILPDGYESKEQFYAKFKPEALN